MSEIAMGINEPGGLGKQTVLQQRTVGNNDADQTQRIPELDGIRGLAILLVLMVHFALVPHLGEPFRSIVSLGWAGVDLFFVLSGYLITSILLRTRSENAYFKSFYLHRCLRILPLYYVFLIGAALLSVAPLSRQIWYWVYLGNVLSATGRSIPGMNHLWSLAIEEQFYAIWPLVIYFLPLRYLARLCYGLIAGEFLARLVATHFQLPSPEFVYTLTPFRCDSLAFGALIACLQAQGTLARLSHIFKWTAALGALTLCYGVYRAGGTGYVEPGIERFGYSGADLLFASFIASAVVWKSSVWFTVIRSALLRFFGKYSYAMYIFHFPIVPLVKKMPVPAVSPVLAATIGFTAGTALAVAASLLSWNLVEKHFLALKSHYRDFGKSASPGVGTALRNASR